MKTFVTVLACLGLLAGSAHAQGPGGAAYAAPGHGAWYVPPDQIVRRGIDRLTGFVIGVPELTPENLAAFVEHEIAPLFDFNYMTRWAAGRHYRGLDPTQRAGLAHTVRQLFLDALVHNMGTYVEPLPVIDIFPARATGPRESRVRARVVGGDGRRVHLEFRFYWSRAGWKIYDVTADGASAVAYYRGYIDRMLREQGADALG